MLEHWNSTLDEQCLTGEITICRTLLQFILRTMLTDILKLRNGPIDHEIEHEQANITAEEECATVIRKQSPNKDMAPPGEVHREKGESLESAMEDKEDGDDKSF